MVKCVVQAQVSSKPLRHKILVADLLRQVTAYHHVAVSCTDKRFFPSLKPFFCFCHLSRSPSSNSQGRAPADTKNAANLAAHLCSFATMVLSAE
jgi:hypothetical protein